MNSSDESVFKASWLNEVCAVVAELAEAPA